MKIITQYIQLKTSHNLQGLNECICDKKKNNKKTKKKNKKTPEKQPSI